VLAMGHLNNLECRVNDNELCAVILIIKLRSQLCVLYAHGPTLQRLGGLLGTSASVCFMHTGQHSKVLGGFLVCDTKRVRLQCMAQILCYCYYTNKGARSSKV
jgi:hypothetical protein